MTKEQKFEAAAREILSHQMNRDLNLDQINEYTRVILDNLGIYVWQEFNDYLETYIATHKLEDYANTSKSRVS